jgi:hypothetical protein
MAKHHWKAWEDEILKTSWKIKTDKEIASMVGRKETAVARRRKLLNLSKKNGRPKAKEKQDAVFKNPTDYSIATLSKEDRIQFYKTQFDKNFRYPYLQRILLVDEMRYYQHKYIEFLDSIDTITIQEEDLLHNMVMTEIELLRVQEQIKLQLEAYLDGEDNSNLPPQYLRKDVSDLEERYMKYQTKLNVTREQRLKSNREEKITVSSLVRAFTDKRNRVEAGQTAGAMSYFTSKCREDMNKMNFLLGG